MKLKLYAIITARKNSKGIKNKNLKKINNDDLVTNQIKILKKSGIAKIFISSDSNKILNKANKFNNIFKIKRPKKFSNDNSPSELAIFHLLKYLKFKNDLPDFLFISQPTSPFLTIANIKKSISILKKRTELGSLISIVKVPHKYHFENQRILKKDNLIEFLFDRKNHTRQSKIQTYVHGNLFIVSVKKFLKQKKILAEPIFSFVLNNNLEALDIDEMYDLKLARVISKNKAKLL